MSTVARKVFRGFLPGIVLLLALVAGLWRFVDLERDPDTVTETSQDAWATLTITFTTPDLTP